MTELSSSAGAPTVGRTLMSCCARMIGSHGDTVGLGMTVRGTIVAAQDIAIIAILPSVLVGTLHVVTYNRVAAACHDTSVCAGIPLVRIGIIAAFETLFPFISIGARYTIAANRMTTTIQACIAVLAVTIIAFFEAGILEVNDIVTNTTITASRHQAEVGAGISWFDVSIVAILITMLAFQQI